MAGSRLKIANISWSELYRDTVELSKKILVSGFIPQKLVVIARGGLVLGRLLSDLLGVKDITIIPVSFYQGIGSTNEKPVILKEIDDKNLGGKVVLIVDDIVDTGETLQAVLEYVQRFNPKELRSAALYVKPWAKILPDYFVRVVDVWVVFPYELRETLEKLPEEYVELLSLDAETIEDIKTIEEYTRNKAQYNEEVEGKSNGLL
ncbi:MAG: phosphoribosyltransferase [Infirmifilum sp.]